MASPTAIPHANKSGHFRRPQPAATPLDLSSEIHTSEGQRLSFSPPSSFYSRASVSGSLYSGSSMSSTTASSSPPNRFSFGSMSKNAAKNDDSAIAAQQHHSRARSHTAIGTGSRPGVESWEDKLPSNRPISNSASSAGSQGSSYISANDLSMSPTSPGSSFSSVGTGYSLGRVPSLPLGASYEHAQKRFNSGSWNQKMGWMNTMRPGPLSPTLSKNSIDESNVEEGGHSGPMGGLLRRFSLSSNTYRGNNAPTGAPASSRIASAPIDSDSASGVPTSATSKAIPIAKDSGVGLADESHVMPPVQRGRQASFGSSTKRKPSPMGERLLMGHFNAH